MSKTQRTRQGGEAWELLPELVAVAVEFFDSSCYGNSKYGILIAAAMDHSYENSAVCQDNNVF